MKRIYLIISLIAGILLPSRIFTASAQTTPKDQLTFVTGLDPQATISLFVTYNEGPITVTGAKLLATLPQTAEDGYFVDAIVENSTITIQGNLTGLGVNDALISSFDLSKAKSLQAFDCMRNSLTQLDLSPLTQLQMVWCSDNDLTQLNVSQNKNLVGLYCSNNPLETLDLSGNESLYTLICFGTNISTLNLSNNKQLEEVNCSACSQLTSLDLTNQELLLTLCTSNTPIENLNLSTCPFLNDLDVSGMQLQSIDLSQNPELIFLNCYENQLSSLDLSGNPKLALINCSYNNLDVLDLSAQKQLSSLSIYRNKIKGEKMTTLVNSLSQYDEMDCFLYVLDSKDELEENVCTKSQVKIATDKQWNVQDLNGWDSIDYEGSEDTGVEAININPQSKLLVYPTVADKNINIKHAQPGAQISLSTLNGTLLLRTTASQSGRAQLSVDEIPTGNYLIHSGNETRKVIVK